MAGRDSAGRFNARRASRCPRDGIERHNSSGGVTQRAARLFLALEEAGNLTAGLL